jgi:metal-sulfur cluster biosynthetic enzyme
MTDLDALKQTLIENLDKVIDPETGASVMRMRLVQDLTVTEGGNVSYIFRPSSPICPIALPLVMEIIEAVKATPGIQHQEVTVVDYAGAEELNRILASLNL